MQSKTINSNIRRLIVSLTTMLCFLTKGSSQCKSFSISVKGDTINCLDVNNVKQGKWIIRIEDLRGEPGYEEEGEFKDGKKEGLWRVYSLMGDVLAFENYRWGNKHGKQQYFNIMGALVREESWLAQNPEKSTETVEVFDVNDPKKVYLVEVKMEASSVPHGFWTIYDASTGKVIRKENFVLGKLDDGSGTANGIIKKESTFSNNAKTNYSTEQAKAKIKPKEIIEFEKKNSRKKNSKMRTGQTGG